MSFDIRRRLDHVLELSLDYILGRQQSDGSWVDWKLPPGESSVWTTAYVGYRLKNIPAYFRKRTQPPMRAASSWLLGNIFADGGWGYTEQTGSDADSTALAILFLLAEGKTVPGTCYSFLQTLQHPDGGFSTYPQNGVVGSWSVSHGDVTPTVVLALLAKYGRQVEIVERGIEYVINAQTSIGVWESFWWTSPLYSTEASLALMNGIGLKMDPVQARRTLLASVCKGAFEKALQLSSLVHLHPKLPDSILWRLIDELLSDQQRDGSWRSCSILRVTHRDCFEPWRPGDSDTLFADTNRLFTTSTVIEALSRIYALLEVPKTYV
jgi:squalene cyclase